MLNFLIKSAVISNIECKIDVRMYDLITRINLILSYLSLSQLQQDLCLSRVSVHGVFLVAFIAFLEIKYTTKWHSCKAVSYIYLYCSTILSFSIRCIEKIAFSVRKKALKVNYKTSRSCMFGIQFWVLRIDYLNTTTILISVVLSTYKLAVIFLSMVVIALHMAW